MKANHRSVSGVALMVLIIPVFAGLLACMPEHVPLGNPDRAKIDPELTGMWVVTGNDDMGTIVTLTPWDKHTWMMTSFFVEESIDGDLSPYELDSYDGIVEMLENEMEGNDGYETAGSMVHKSWLSKVSGEQFMTTDIRGLISEEGLLSSWWFLDYRLEKLSSDEFTLQMINEDFEALKEAPKTRRGWEKVIRRNKDDDHLYLEDVARFQRIRTEHIELFGEVVNTTYGIF